MNAAFSAHRSLRPVQFAAAMVAALLAACGGGGGGADAPAAAAASVTGVALSSATPMYSQELLVTVTGSNLDQGLSVTSAGCKNATRSTTAPTASNASTAYYKCTVSAVGASQVVGVAAAGGGAVQKTASFAVAPPQVTLTLSNGSGGSVSGDVVLALDPAKTPITVDNFLAYVNAGFYVGTIMHRVVPSFVVQGGGYLPLNGGTTPVAKATKPPIKLEVGKGLSNLQWSVAMAREDNADTATSQFFINLVDNVALDTNLGGYAVFGNVSAGTAVVTALAGVSCAPRIPGFLSECPPSPDVVITSAAQTR